MKTKLFHLPIFVMLLLPVTTTHAALVISNLNTTSTLNFTGFTGAGFAPTPSAGQLDSDAWRVTGLSDGTGSFGGTHTSGDFARGASIGGVTTAGVYAFEVASGNTALGVQPAGSDFTPGAFTLRIQNTTGNTVFAWNLAYSLYVQNDEDRSNSLNWEWSTDDNTYTSITAYTSIATADTSPAWVNVLNPSANSLSARVANNDFLYLRWNGNDVGGSGSRDEFAIDDISVTAVIPEPSTTLAGVLLGMGLMRRRRRA